MCECIERMNGSLAQHNGRIAVAIQITPSMDLRSRLIVQTEKLDKSRRKPVPTVVATYCPFCGEKTDLAA